jgi:hypothetical protein
MMLWNLPVNAIRKVLVCQPNARQPQQRIARAGQISSKLWMLHQEHLHTTDLPGKKSSRDAKVRAAIILLLPCISLAP